jgi:ribosomal protein S18 acetylase RimI-like enzyme
MPKDYIYRRLTIDDISLVLKLNDDFRSGLVSQENAREFLSNKMNWLIGCIFNNKIIGFAYGYELQRMNNIGNMLYIHEIGVLESFQRQGIGTTILKTIMTICKLNSFCRFFLATERSNIKACNLYKKMNGTESHTDDVIYYFSKL